MIAPYARTAVEIELTTELSSRPYVDMTLAIMQDFGVPVQRQGYERFLEWICIALMVALAVDTGDLQRQHARLTRASLPAAAT